MGNKNIRQAWDQLAAMHGSKTAVVFEDAVGNISEYSYAEFNGEINRAANLFLSLGIEKGDRVATQLNNCPEFLISWFGLAKIGAITVPINAQCLRNECEYIIQHCEIKTVIVESQFVSHYQSEDAGGSQPNILVARIADHIESSGTINFSRELKNQPSELLQNVPVSSDDIAEIIFTSGTTSCPKGVVITHYNLLFAGHYSSWMCSLRDDDRYLTIMPACHIDFQCTTAMPAFHSGAALILVEKYSATKFWGQICHHRATVTECIPLVIRTLMLQPEAPWEKEHQLREVLFYLNLSEKEKEQFTKRFNVRLLTSYGMTETIVGNITDTPGFERRWPAIGRPGFCYEVRIVDASNQEVKPGELGEIVIKGIPGKTLFREYYNNPEATAKTYDSEGWLHTGDFARMDNDGYFFFVDRNVNLIKRSGENISSTEIENVLITHSQILDAAVIGVPDEMYDEIVKAVVVQEESAFLTEADIQGYCSERLAKFKVPAVIEFRKKLPRTSTGKVKKSLLKNERVCVWTDPDPLSAE